VNNFRATVTQIENLENLNIVKFDFCGTVLSMMSLDLSQEIQIATQVELTAKSTNIAIGKNFSGQLSYSNQLQAKIISLTIGKLLTSVTLSAGDVLFESIITSYSSKKMDLKVGDEVVALIKASELSIQSIV
jgi:molybdopterin-binding protein